MRPHLKSTLFPYTTLFRSIGPARDAGPPVPEGFVDGVRHTNPSGTGGDRKSTRLNSSHQIISYAVFCLKKNKRSNRLRVGGESNVPISQAPTERTQNK